MCVRDDSDQGDDIIYPVVFESFEVDVGRQVVVCWLPWQEQFVNNEMAIFSPADTSSLPLVIYPSKHGYTD